MNTRALIKTHLFQFGISPSSLSFKPDDLHMCQTLSKGTRCKRKMCLHGLHVWLMSSALKGQFTKNDNEVTHLATNTGIHAQHSRSLDWMNRFINQRWGFSINRAGRPGDTENNRKRTKMERGVRRGNKNQSLSQNPSVILSVWQRARFTVAKFRRWMLEFGLCGNQRL